MSGIEGIKLSYYFRGRVRFKVKKLKGHPEFGERMQQALAEVHGITHVEPNPVNGGVLIRFTPKELSSPAGCGQLGERLRALFPEIDGEALEGTLGQLCRLLK